MERGLPFLFVLSLLKSQMVLDLPQNNDLNITGIKELDPNQIDGDIFAFFVKFSLFVKATAMADFAVKLCARGNGCPVFHGRWPEKAITCKDEKLVCIV
ncbi:MAG: hypothetical protein QM786_16665 [Breznakibacter sp.]